MSSGDVPWIRIGSSLCGKAAGCDQILEAVHAELNTHGLQANVSEVGCIGLCYAEPLMDIMLPGGPRVFYGKMDSYEGPCRHIFPSGPSRACG